MMWWKTPYKASNLQDLGEKAKNVFEWLMNIDPYFSVERMPSSDLDI